MRLTLITLVVVAPALAFGQAQELENPGTVSAVQERLYRMNHELTLGLGALPLDAFYKGFYGQVAYSFHFTDEFAWQVGRGAYSYNVNTGLRDQLENQFDVNPTSFEEVQWMVGSDLIWSPFYGKTAVLNRSVVHFEAYLIGGGTLFRFNNSFRPGVNLGVGGRLFHNRLVSYRLDITNNVVLATTRSAGFFNVMTVQAQVALNFGATE